jgi:hypothetical protein
MGVWLVFSDSSSYYYYIVNETMSSVYLGKFIYELILWTLHDFHCWLDNKNTCTVWSQHFFGVIIKHIPRNRMTSFLTILSGIPINTIYHRWHFHTLIQTHTHIHIYIGTLICDIQAYDYLFRLSDLSEKWKKNMAKRDNHNLSLHSLLDKICQSNISDGDFRIMKRKIKGIVYDITICINHVGTVLNIYFMRLR